MKVLYRFIKIIEIISKLLYSIVSLLFIGFVAYLLGGHAFLNQAWGTDISNAIGILTWIDKYYPNIPFWFPVSGGGVSIVNSYPVFSFQIASFINKISSLNIIQSFTLLGFISILAMATSIYLFCSIRLKNQTVGLIAAIFFLMAPITWTWLIQWGFYAEVIAYTFVGFSIIFWDLFFTSFIKDGFINNRQRIYLFLTIVFLSLSFASHFTTGFVIIYLFAFYIIGFAIKKKEKKKILYRGTIALVIVAIASILLTLTISFPFQRYSGIAAQAGLTSGHSYEQIKMAELSVLKVLGFKIYDPKEFLFAVRAVSFPAIISIFAFIGILLSFRSARLISFSLFSIFALLLSTNGDFMYWTIKYIPQFLSAGIGWRAMFIVLRITWPILAAVGLVGVVSLPFFWAKKKALITPKKVIIAILSLALAAVSISGFVFFQKQEKRFFIYNYGAFKEYDIRNIFSDYDKQSKLWTDRCTYGKQKADEEYLYGGVKKWCNSPIHPHFLAYSVGERCDIFKNTNKEMPELCFPENLNEEKVLNFWNKCKENKNISLLCISRVPSIKEQLEIKNWPAFSLPNTFNPIPKFKNDLDNIAKINPNARIDIAPQMSPYSMAAQFYNVDNNLSQMHIYHATASLLLRFQGWQQMVYYLNLPQYSMPSVINDLARWFGINYVFSGGINESLFIQAGWEKSSRGFKFFEKNSLVDFSNKTAILAIGQSKLASYDQVLITSLLGAIPYEKAFLVWGKDSIDDYSLEELRNFDILILHGFNYKNKGKADKLLDEYVNKGGSVFIDTGWQYSVPEWESENPLSIIPLNELLWKDFGKTSNYTHGSSDLLKNIDVEKFGPLIYIDEPWGVSTSEDIRPNSTILISVNNNPLIMSWKYGKGKVVWSGMNIFVHSKQDQVKIYLEEIKFLNNIFTWLAPSKKSTNFNIAVLRDNPDRVEFTIKDDVPNGGFIYWKEGYFPDFKAKLVTKSNEKTSLSTYRGGPGFSLIKVPNAQKGDKVVYQYEKALSEKIAQLISIFTFILLIFLIIDGFLGKKSFLIKIMDKLKKTQGNIFTNISFKPKNIFKNNNEEEDY